jgi:hypothetical protein
MSQTDLKRIEISIFRTLLSCGTESLIEWHANGFVRRLLEYTDTVTRWLCGYLRLLLT